MSAESTSCGHSDPDDGTKTELRFADGDANRTMDVEATDLGIEVNGSVISWGWILRALARIEDRRTTL